MEELAPVKVCSGDYDENVPSCYNTGGVDRTFGWRLVKQTEPQEENELAKKRTDLTPKEFTSGFKLPKPVKRVMSLQFTDQHARGAYKRAMVAAEKTYLSNKKKQPGRADSGSDD